MFAPRCIALLASTTQLPPVAAGNWPSGSGNRRIDRAVRGAASRRSATVTPPDGRANKRKPAEGATRHELLRCFKRGLPEVRYRPIFEDPGNLEKLQIITTGKPRCLHLLTSENPRLGRDTDIAESPECVLDFAPPDRGHETRRHLGESGRPPLVAVPISPGLQLRRDPRVALLYGHTRGRPSLGCWPARVIVEHPRVPALDVSGMCPPSRDAAIRRWPLVMSGF